MMRLLSICIFILLVPLLAGAQVTSSDFVVRVFGGLDISPPTTPSLTATAVATSQINLTWSTSTDNAAVFGYVVYRDAVAVATTTQVSYSDVGLVPSTTYAYTVRAFDGSLNYSSSSATSSATTLSLPVVVEEDEVLDTTSVARPRVTLTLDELIVTPGVATATIRLTTNDVSRIEVRLGTTSSYEQFYMVGNAYDTEHSIFLTDLLPQTRYYFEIIGYTKTGAQLRLARDTFTTLSGLPPLPPANVANVAAVQVGEHVRITYQIPDGLPGGSIVRIVRSPFGFPSSPFEGVIVYEGLSTDVLDRGVFLTNQAVYYTLFVITPDRRISSGAIAYVVDSRGGDSVEGGDQASTTEDDQPSERPPIIAAGFPKPADIWIEQATRTYSFASTSIVLSGTEPVRIYVPASVITGDFKTIIVTLSDPRNRVRSFSFLLRLNQQDATYSAVLAPVLAAGQSTVTVEVFDYDARVLSRYHAEVLFTYDPPPALGIPVWVWQLQVWLWTALLLVPLFVLLLLRFVFVRRERSQNEDNKSAR